MVLAAAHVGRQQPQQFLPFYASDCLAVRQANEVSIKCHALQVAGNEMYYLRTRQPRPDPTLRHGPAVVQGQPSLPGHRQVVWTLQEVRYRSRHSLEARRRRCAGQHAMADDGSSEGQG